MQELLLAVANIGPIGFYLKRSTRVEKGLRFLIGAQVAENEVPEERQGLVKQTSE